MGTTLNAIYIALQIAPLIALGLIVPYVVVSYTRARSLNVRWCTYIYILVLYFLCAYFMTLLPLPSKESIANMRPINEMIQLIPFKNFYDIKAESWLHDIAILIFNVFLTVPFGFFLRYLFGFDLKKTILAGLLTSLLYEITQITGIFFIYPRPYRFFDVDDLIINTLGAIVGYYCVPLIARFLPTPFDDEHMLTQGSEVSFFQRCVASLIDFAIVLCACILTIVCVPSLKTFLAEGRSLWRFPAFYILFLGIAALYAMLFRGGTLGNKLTGLRLMTAGGKAASRLRCAMRFLTICTSVIAIPFWVYFFMTVNGEYAGVKSVIWVSLGALLMMFAASILLEMMFNAVTHGSSMFYDRFWKTFVAYGHNRNFSLFGIKVIDIQPLTKANVDLFSAEISQTLTSMGVSNASVIKARLMTEGIMLDWIDSGLEDVPCEFRIDKQYKRNLLMLSVPGDDKTNTSLAGSYAEMLSGLNLTIESYYAAEKNICTILIL
jgi:glycopeptide antibiotics resistance protein